MKKPRLFSILTSFVMLITTAASFSGLTLTADASSAATFLEIAELELGNNYSKYTHVMHDDGNGNYAYAWCAAFVSYCAKKARVTNIYQSTLCTEMYKNSGGTKRTITSSTSYIPQAGDIVFYHLNTSNQNELNHVDIVERYDGTKKQIHTISGNSGSTNPSTSSVKRMTRDYNSNTCGTTIKYIITPTFNSNPINDGSISDYPRPFDNETVSIGMRGVSVLWVQQALQRSGININDDGIFGDETRSAVISFQGLHGLKQDGIVGKDTINAIVSRFSSGGTTPPVSASDNPYTVPSTGDVLKKAQIPARSNGCNGS